MMTPVPRNDRMFLLATSVFAIVLFVGVEANVCAQAGQCLRDFRETLKIPLPPLFMCLDLQAMLDCLDLADTCPEDRRNEWATKQVDQHKDKCGDLLAPTTSSPCVMAEACVAEFQVLPGTPDTVICTNLQTMLDCMEREETCEEKMRRELAFDVVGEHESTCGDMLNSEEYYRDHYRDGEDGGDPMCTSGACTCDYNDVGMIVGMTCLGAPLYVTGAVITGTTSQPTTEITSPVTEDPTLTGDLTLPVPTGFTGLPTPTGVTDLPTPTSVPELPATTEYPGPIPTLPPGVKPTATIIWTSSSCEGPMCTTDTGACAVPTTSAAILVPMIMVLMGWA